MRVGLVVAGVLLFGAVAYLVVLDRRIERFAVRPTGGDTGATTFLLVGSDERDWATDPEDAARFGGTAQTPGARADVLLAVRVDVDGSARLLRISRDLTVAVDDAGTLVRVAEVYLNGPQAMLDALCRSVGLAVDHVAVLDLGGLREVVGAIGGIDVTVPAAARDVGSGLELRAGPNHLDGDDVLAYASSRRLELQRPDGTWVPDPVAATDRAKRVAGILHDVTGQLRPRPTDPVRTHALAWALTGALRVDTDLSLGEAWRLVRALNGTGGADGRPLPVTTAEGAVPVDTLEEEASADVLRWFDGADGPGGRCASPRFPAARR